MQMSMLLESWAFQQEDRPEDPYEVVSRWRSWNSRGGQEKFQKEKPTVREEMEAWAEENATAAGRKESLGLTAGELNDPVWSVALHVSRLLHPWDSPGKNTGVGCLSLLQGIFPTQGSNPGLPHCRQTLYRLSYQGSPKHYEGIWKLMFLCSWKKKRVIINTKQGFPCLIQVKPPSSLVQSKCLENDCHLYTGSLVRTVGGCRELCKCKLLSSPVAGRGIPSRAREQALV